jgi:hypothetical protein
MKQIDTEKTEVALGLQRIDVRTISRSYNNLDKPEAELRLHMAYWLKSIQPYIAGRKIHGAELYIANNAHSHLKGIAKYAAEWWNTTEDGKKSPIPPESFPDWEKEEFYEPEELFADQNLKPEILAGIAATLVKTGRKNQTPAEAVRDAHELLLAAERYIGTLPKQARSITEQLERQDFCKIAFAEILRSNESGKLPLLPPVQTGRNGGKLTMNALKTAVKRFLQQNAPTITKEQFEKEEEEWARTVRQNKEDIKTNKLIPEMSRIGSGKTLTYREWQKLNQDSINDCLENNRISAHLITELRWERFRHFYEKQQSRSDKRQRPELRR